MRKDQTATAIYRYETNKTNQLYCKIFHFPIQFLYPFNHWPYARVARWSREWYSSWMSHQSAPPVQWAGLHQATLHWSAIACTLMHDKKSLSLDELNSRDLDDFIADAYLQKGKREGSTGDWTRDLLQEWVTQSRNHTARPFSRFDLFGRFCHCPYTCRLRAIHWRFDPSRSNQYQQPMSSQR